MSSLYFVCSHDNVVFTFSPAADGEWRFSRLSTFQKNKGLEKFMLLYKTSEQSGGWVVQDQTASKAEVVGQPCKELAAWQGPEGPPLGEWLLWGTSFRLARQPPRHPALALNPRLEVPFATVNYSEEGSVARLEVTMHNVPIVDEVLEQVLARFATILQNLAQRPEMVLFIRSDARNSAVPAVRHIKRFLGFVQENGSEFVLVGRGHAIVLSPKGILGNTLLAILRLVQRVFPAPWPESTVPTMDAAEDFLMDLAKQELQQRPSFSSREAPLERESSGQSSPPTALVVRQESPVDIISAPCRSRPPSRQQSEATVGDGSHIPDVERREDDDALAEALPLTPAPETPRCRGLDSTAIVGDDIETPASSDGSSFPWFCSACRPCHGGSATPPSC